MVGFREKRHAERSRSMGCNHTEVSEGQMGTRLAWVAHESFNIRIEIASSASLLAMTAELIAAVS